MHFSLHSLKWTMQGDAMRFERTAMLGASVAADAARMMIQELNSNSPILCREWDDYVNRHPDSNCYHDRVWQSVAERVYRLPTRFLLAKEAGLKGRIVGVLPLFQVRGLVRAHLSNGIFGAYAGPLADFPEVKTALIQRAKEITEEENLQYLLFKTLGNELCDASQGFTSIHSWVIATLPLAADPDQMWSHLRDKIRNCIRKATKAGLEVRSGPDQLEHYYDVLAENMHRKGSPIYGFEFMKMLSEGAGDRCEIITLWQGGRVISGALTLRHKDTVYVPFASSRPDSLQMSPNNLLYWEIMRRNCLRGVKTLDFGRSPKDSGPLSFKLGWGATVIEQSWHFYSPRGDQMKDPRQGGVDFFVKGWKRIPRRWADAWGPQICRQVAGLL